MRCTLQVSGCHLHLFHMHFVVHQHSQLTHSSPSIAFCHAPPANARKTLARVRLRLRLRFLPGLATCRASYLTPPAPKPAHTKRNLYKFMPQLRTANCRPAAQLSSLRGRVPGLPQSFAFAELKQLFACIFG